MVQKRIVVDASVMVKWLRSEREEYVDRADMLLHDVQEENIELYAPELAKYEVGNVLIKRKLKPKEAAISLTTYYTIPIHFVQETKELAKISYAIADSLHITYYDAAYLALAQEIDAIVITENTRHLGKATTAQVLALSDY